MGSLVAGTPATVYVPVSSTITVTPGTGGKVSLNGRNAAGDPVTPMEIYSTTSVTLSAGSTISMLAEGGAATYTDPAGMDTSLQALVLRAGIGYPRATFVGDSINYMGVRYGALVPTGLIFSNGVNLFLASLYTNTAGTGTIEWSLPLQSLRYTAPSDTAGPWVPMTRSQRFRIASANGLWIEGSFFRDVMATLASTSTSVTYTGSPSNASLTRGVPEWLEFLSYGRLYQTNICAPGASIRHLSDLMMGLPANPGLVVVQIGTNDVIGARTVAQIEADFLAAAPSLVSVGAIVCSIPAYAWSTAAQRNAWNAFNTSVVPAICERYGITFVNVWGATVDPTSTTAPKANRLQADNVHPAGPGAEFAALQLQPFVSPLSATMVTQSPMLAYDATNNPNGNLAGNVGYSGTGGAVAGTNVSAGGGGVPDGYTAGLFSGTVTGCVVQKVAATDGGNDWLEYAITGASAGATFRLEHSLGVGSTVPVAGQPMEATVEWAYVAGSGGALRGIDARLQPVTTTAPIGYSMLALDSMQLPDVGVAGVTPPPAVPWTVPTGATAVRWQAFITMGSGNATVRLRNPSMRIVPA
jgi:hypothetical protein